MLAPSRDYDVAAPFWRANPAVAAALAIAIVGAATIAGAWFFELVLKLRPCPLCLEQRVPYYIGIPLALVVAFAAWRGAPRALVIGGLDRARGADAVGRLSRCVPRRRRVEVLAGHPRSAPALPHSGRRAAS